MTTALQNYSTILGVLVVLTQVSILILLAGLVFKSYLPEPMKKHLHKNGMKYAALVAFAAFLGPLGYSEIFNFEPCKFCWYQRIFMFPLSLSLPFAEYRKEITIKPYAMLLASVGALIALYHVLMQWGVISPASTSCGVVGQSVSCNVIFVHTFGYLTIPMMALTAFAAIIVLLVYQK